MLIILQCGDYSAHQLTGILISINVLPRKKGAQRRNITNFYSRALFVSPSGVRIYYYRTRLCCRGIIKSQVRSGEFSSIASSHRRVYGKHSNSFLCVYVFVCMYVCMRVCPHSSISRLALATAIDDDAVVVARHRSRRPVYNGGQYKTIYYISFFFSSAPLLKYIGNKDIDR